MKIFKGILKDIMLHGVLAAIIWCGIPACMVWGISRLFASGCITVNNITITDINAVCAIIAAAVGMTIYAIVGMILSKKK